MEPIPVWIDCDPGVDDAVALLLAGRMPELQLVGLSAVAGNVCLERTLGNLLKLRELMEVRVPVYAGASGPRARAAIDASAFHGADGLGGVPLPPCQGGAEEAPAWEALHRAAKARPGALTLISLGPLTNVAEAFEQHPDLPGLLGRLLIMGGSVSRGNRTAWAEFNILADPEAAEQVLTAKVPKVLCGLDVTRKAYMTRQELDQVAEASWQCRLLVRMQENALDRVTAAGAPGLPMHDPCPVLYAVFPELFQGTPAALRVITEEGPQLGRTVLDPEGQPNCTVITEVDRPAFVERVKKILERYHRS